jgi:NTP pyrophosphatase (non-canonical NTP hydrolase)
VAVDLDEYQNRASLTDQRPGSGESALVFPLIGLASEIGSLVNQYKKRVRDGEAHALFSTKVAEELGDVLWYVSNLATKLGLTLDEVAALNLRRTAERWPITPDLLPRALLDDAFPEPERLPRQGEVSFVQTYEGERQRVRIFSQDRQLGSPLSDMAWDDDAYRFHDAFHFTYAALLGWSPITRWFFHCQRDSDARLREIEDSGRAKVLEEAVAAVAFEYAREERFLDGVTHLDFALLETIRGMTSRLEVRVRTTHEWERAILRSFEVWRRLRELGGGIVRWDMHQRIIEVAPLSGDHVT